MKPKSITEELKKEIKAGEELESKDLLNLSNITKLFGLKKQLQATQTAKKKVMEVIDELVRFTCECNCVTFKDGICNNCKDPKKSKYGEIDYDELKKRIDEVL